MSIDCIVGLTLREQDEWLSLVAETECHYRDPIVNFKGLSPVRSVGVGKGQSLGQRCMAGSGDANTPPWD